MWTLRAARSFLKVLVLCLACFGVAFSSLAAQAQTCEPRFALTGEWQGADVAYSIPLKDGRDLWLFGDTLYGQHRVVHDKNPQMVRNSIGLSTCIQGEWNMQYVIRKDKEGHHKDFFAARKPGTFYWPMDGFERDGELWIVMLCVRDAPEKPMGFVLCGTDLAHVTSLGPDPERWRMQVQPLQESSDDFEIGSSVVPQGEWVYFITRNVPGKGMILGRVAYKNLEHAWDSMEWLVDDHRWSKAVDLGKASIIIRTPAPEMSVRYHRQLKRWIAIMVDPTLMSSDILLASSPALEGPWTEARPVHTIPELGKSFSQYDKDTFCYAGKEHPEFEKEDVALITYACNSFVPKKLETLDRIYFPQVVKIPIGQLAKP